LKPKAKAKRGTLDWAAIRAEYEAGESARGLARKHGCSKTAIVKHVHAEGWQQDAEAAIQRRTAEKVSGLVASELPAKRSEAIDAEAGRRAEVVRRHREETNDVRALMHEGLRAHKEATGTNAKKLSDKDASAAREAAFDTLKAAKIASETIINLHRAERKAWGLDTGEGDGKGDGFIGVFHAEIRAAREARAKGAT
jgi:hypothetical protein